MPRQNQRNQSKRNVQALYVGDNQQLGKATHNDRRQVFFQIRDRRSSAPASFAHLAFSVRIRLISVSIACVHGRGHGVTVETFLADTHRSSDYYCAWITKLVPIKTTASNSMAQLATMVIRQSSSSPRSSRPASRHRCHRHASYTRRAQPDVIGAILLDSRPYLLHGLRSRPSSHHHHAIARRA